MKILIANAHRSIVGGAERYIRTVISQLLTLGHEIAVVHTWPAETGAMLVDPRDKNVPAWCITSEGSSAALKGIEDWQPDVVFGHGI